MFKRLLCAIWLVPLAASACPNVVDTELSRDVYASEVEALRAVTAGVLAESIARDVEFAGAVYRMGADVRVSIGRGCPGADSIRFASPIVGDAIPIAFWHTHGSDGFARDRFSPDDVRLVLEVGRPFYLITPRGDVRVLEPRTARSSAAREIVRRSLVRGANRIGVTGRRVG